MVANRIKEIDDIKGVNHKKYENENLGESDTMFLNGVFSVYYFTKQALKSGMGLNQLIKFLTIPPTILMFYMYNVEIIDTPIIEDKDFQSGIDECQAVFVLLCLLTENERKKNFGTKDIRYIVANMPFGHIVGKLLKEIEAD